MKQLDLFDFAASAIVPELPQLLDQRREVMTRAGPITVYPDCREPIEVTVRGIPCVIAFGWGFATHAIDPAGSPFWSETGYRSFTGWQGSADEATADEIVAAIERYIDAPAKHGNGCGGELTTWWPGVVLQLRQQRDFLSRCPEYLDRDSPREREAEDRVRAAGFDPDVVAPWPTRCRQRAML